MEGGNGVCDWDAASCCITAQRLLVTPEPWGVKKSLLLHYRTWLCTELRSFLQPESCGGQKVPMCCLLHYIFAPLGFPECSGIVLGWTAAAEASRGGTSSHCPGVQGFQEKPHCILSPASLICIDAYTPATFFAGLPELALHCTTSQVMHSLHTPSLLTWELPA